MNSKLIELINKIAVKESLYTVYSDFVALTALAISNTCDFENRDKREKQYLNIIEKYKEEAILFPHLYSELVEEMNKGFNDVLGSLFMELGLGSKTTGQFFTPYHIAQATAGALFDKEQIDKQIKEKGYISLLEPSCGGGAMVIALAEEMHKRGYNPQKQLVVECNDLDVKGVYMTYVQLSLYGIPAVVNHADSLTLSKYDTFKTPAYILDGWEFRRRQNINGG